MKSISLTLLFYACIVVTVLFSFEDVLAQALPDLYVTSSKNSITVNQGKNIGRPELTVGNKGTACANSFTFNTYVSRSALFDGTGKMGSTQIRPRLCPPYDGDVEAASLLIEKYAPGTYYAHFVVDVGNSVKELNESNNIKTITIIIKGATPPPPPPKPDFAVKIYEFYNLTQNNSNRFSITTQDLIEIKYEVTNSTSVAYNGPFRVDIAISKNNTGGISFTKEIDEITATQTFNNGIGANGTRNGTVQFFAQTPGNKLGNLYIKAYADRSENVSETNESNNLGTLDIKITQSNGRVSSTPSKTNTKINENISTSDVLVYPNPFIDKINFVLDIASPSQVTIHDIAGKLIWKKEYEGVIEETVDFNTQAPGVYMLKVINQEGTQVRKFVKN